VPLDRHSERVQLVVTRPDLRVLEALVEVGVVTPEQRRAVQVALDRMHREDEEQLDQEGRLAYRGASDPFLRRPQG
jgi:hypothetical protein